MKEFRVKLRLKSIKPLKNKYLGIPWAPSPLSPAIQPSISQPYRCPRCGIEWKGAMGYCCPEGQWCGVPRTVSAPVTYTRIITGTSTTIAGRHATSRPLATLAS